MKTARYTATAALINVTKNNAFSNIEFKTAAKGLTKQDAAFAAALFYGVLERKITLDYILNKYIKGGVESLDNEVLNILRCGIYQLKYMNSVTDSAAVNECVKLASMFKKTSAKGLINAILRKFIRENKQFDLPKDNINRLSIEYSCKPWIIKLLIDQYGIDFTTAYLKESLASPPIYIRVNTIKVTPQKLIDFFAEDGIIATKTNFDDNCLILKNSGDIEYLSEYKNGMFHVQDAASQLCIKAVSPQKGNIVLDMCSAPGSKAFTAAQYMNNSGSIRSFDLYKHKIELIKNTASRLGINIIDTAINNAQIFCDELYQTADIVMCDVPCSGLGIIRRKPEIKYSDRDAVDNLPKIQYEILKTASQYVKPGGKLVYSTCTLNQNENKKVVDRFLSENISFKPLQLSSILDTIKDMDNYSITLSPQNNNSDGFYFALMTREE